MVAVARTQVGVLRQGGGAVGRPDKKPANTHAVRGRARGAPAGPRRPRRPGPAGGLQPAGPHVAAGVRVHRPEAQAGRGDRRREPGAAGHGGGPVRDQRDHVGPQQTHHVLQVPGRAAVPGLADHQVPGAVQHDQRAAERRQPVFQPVRVLRTGDPAVRPAELAQRHRRHGADHPAAVQHRPGGAAVRRPAGRPEDLRQLSVAQRRNRNADQGRRFHRATVGNGTDERRRARVGGTRLAELQGLRLGHPWLLAVRHSEHCGAVLSRRGFL